MPDNIDEEHSDNPTNTQSENLSERVNAVNDTETIPQNQETENMEVHKHPHHVTHKKKWGEYVLEFLMLFLAVFLGFLAENYHVHLVNEEIEKRNIESLIHNLESDTSFLTKSIKFSDVKLKLTDSLTKLPGGFFDTLYQKKFVNYALKLSYSDPYKPDESAFLQMQSSNALRLIVKQNVTDSILKYHQKNIVLLEQQRYVNTVSNSALDKLIETTDYRKLPNFNFNGNSQKMQEYINCKIQEQYGTLNYVYNFLKPQLQAATNLINLLKKEYGIE